MTTTLHEATVGRFEQILTATAAFLEKGRVHFEANGVDLAEIVETRLYPNMLPLRFQVVSTAHHSAGALAAAGAGEFRPPPDSDGTDYATLEACIREALEKVRSDDADELNALEDNPRPPTTSCAKKGFRSASSTSSVGCRLLVRTFR